MYTHTWTLLVLINPVPSPRSVYPSGRTNKLVKLLREMSLGADLRTARKEAEQEGGRGMTAKADNLVASRAVTPLRIVLSSPCSKVCNAMYLTLCCGRTNSAITLSASVSLPSGTKRWSCNEANSIQTRRHIELMTVIPSALASRKSISTSENGGILDSASTAKTCANGGALEAASCHGNSSDRDSHQSSPTFDCANIVRLGTWLLRGAGFAVVLVAGRGPALLPSLADLFSHLTQRCLSRQFREQSFVQSLSGHSSVTVQVTVQVPVQTLIMIWLHSACLSASEASGSAKCHWYSEYYKRKGQLSNRLLIHHRQRPVAYKMDALIPQIEALARAADEHGRKQLIDKLNDLAISLEQPQDTAQRLLYSQFPLAAVRVGCDLKIFEALTKTGRPATVDELSRNTGVQPRLMARLLRYMASVRLIKEVDQNTFAANNVTGTFANPGFAGGVYHYFDYVGPAVTHMPDFLKQTSYKEPESATKTALSAAWNHDMSPFVHYQTKPELFAHFNRFMSVQRLGMPTWLDVYPYQELAKNAPSGEPLFVDVGGGFGHQSIALREKVLDAPGRIIVQDIPATLEHAISHPGVEHMVQDFFQLQQIQGATAYYMRNIIHDYPEEKALQILRNTKDALGPNSVILIDDMFLENKGVHWQAAQIDITMMTCLSSLERTREQWNDLIAKAGLKISKVYTYTEKTPLLKSFVLLSLPTAIAGTSKTKFLASCGQKCHLPSKIWDICSQLRAMYTLINKEQVSAKILGKLARFGRSLTAFACPAISSIGTFLCVHAFRNALCL
ncbi:O-methyltransferase, partial [Aureobasidium melanogenum]